MLLILLVIYHTINASGDEYRGITRYVCSIIYENLAFRADSVILWLISSWRVGRLDLAMDVQKQTQEQQSTSGDSSSSSSIIINNNNNGSSSSSSGVQPEAGDVEPCVMEAKQCGLNLDAGHGTLEEALGTCAFEQYELYRGRSAISIGGLSARLWRRSHNGGAQVYTSKDCGGEGGHVGEEMVGAMTICDYMYLYNCIVEDDDCTV